MIIAMKFFIIILLVFFTALSCSSQRVEDEIVLINIETIPRGPLAGLIYKVDSLNPKVIGLDVMFQERTKYEDDLQLISVLYNCKNLVMARLIKGYSTEDTAFDQYVSLAPEFLPENAHNGFTNAILDDNKKPILNRFSIRETVKDNLEYHFSIRVAMFYDSLKTLNFIHGHERLVDVDYKNGKRKFNTFSASDVLSGKLTEKDIRGKIVMLGFLGPGNEDKFFTPLNEKSNEPDMYGLEYLANIVAQVLEYNK